MKQKCGTTYCDWEEGHVGSHCMAYATPTPTHRIELAAGLIVYVPIKPVKP